jgi:RHS repeat-associated protein
MKNVGDRFISFDVDNSFYDYSRVQTWFHMVGDELYQPIPFNLTPDRKYAFAKNNYRLGFFISGGIIEFEFTHSNSRDMLLKDIDSDGVAYMIQYGQYGINQSGQDFTHFQKYNNQKEKYPLIDPNFLPNTSVVSKIRFGNSTKYLTKSFSYASPVFDLHGLGFLGFKGIVSTNWYDKTENMYKNIREFDITKRGALKKESVISGNQWDSFIPPASGGGGIPIAKSYESITNYEYNSQQLANKVFKLQNTKITHTDYAGRAFSESFVKEVANVFNNYNDITKQTVQYKYNSGLAVIGGSSNLRLDKTEITENTYGYNPSASNYYMSRLTKTKKTQTALNEASFVSEDTFTYDDKGRVTEIKKKGNNTAAITEKNTYDINGNITEKSVSAGSLAPRVMKYKYGYQGRFMTEQTDIDGLKTKYTYNSAKGLLTGETNPYGQTTKYGYNNWGQQTSVTDYLGKVTKTSYIKNGKIVEITTTNDEGAWSKEYFDVWGNKTKASVKNITGDLVHKNFEYDVYNRVVKESENYLGSTPLLWTTTAYDKKGRIKKVTDSKGKEITTTYSLTKTTVNDGTTTKEVVVNAAGEVVSRKDAGGTINYKYFSNGNMKSADYGGVVIAVEQDGWGRKTKLTDPSAGVYTYEYNALGELVKETTPKGNTQFTLDDTGKITQKKISGDQTNSEINYIYDTTTKLLTQSQAVIGGQNYTYNYSYDSNKRLNKTVETTPLATFTKEVTYDEYGRTAQETFKATAYGKTTEKKIKNSYKNGYHWQVTDAVTNVVLTSKENTNEYGLLTKIKLGNQLEINNTYNKYGYMTNTNVRQGMFLIEFFSNTFDVKRGNLLSRKNALFNRNETFGYDELDRLTSFTNKAGIQETQVYDNRGRIESNSVGDYDYTGTASYQLESIDLNAEAQTYYQLRPEQQVLYNAFKSPVWIKEQGKENIYFEYNANNQRSVMYYGNEAADKAQSSFRRHYSADGAMEITYDVATAKADFVTYIDGDAYSATVIAKGETVQEYFYLHRDYLGSILAITNAGGAIVEKRHFDAWGNLVFVKDGQNNDLAKLTFLDRGYTGHEHLQGVALIHMNGRLYDPVVKRFLAPDNFVQDPTNTQNFNRYGYVLNNPLVYMDQNGEWIHIAIGAVIGGLVNWGMHGFKFDMDGLKAFGVGALAGGIGAATGGAAFTALGGGAAGMGGFLAGAGSGAVGAFTSSMTLSIGNNIALGDPLMTPEQILLGTAIGGVTGGLINGGTALAHGRKFLDGNGGMVKPLPITIQSAGVQSIEPEISLSSSATAKSVPDLSYTNEIKSVGNVVNSTEGQLVGGPLYVTSKEVLPEITINAAKGGTNTVTRSESVLGHIFRDASGHVNPSTITSQNRYINLFEKVGNNATNLNPNVLNNFQRSAGGFQGFSQTFRNGKQVWVQTINGKIFDAGVNIIPK